MVGSRYPSSKGPDGWLNTASFVQPALGTFGNLGRDSLRSDWNKNLDLSIFRQFAFTERFRMEFRFEMFNATNTPVWAIPITTIDDKTNFGKVSHAANVPRQLQFGLKLYF